MKEGKVIKIMRRERRELVGVVQSVRVELALFQRCAFSSSELRVCVFFLASLVCRGVRQPEAAISSLSLLSTSVNLIQKSLTRSFVLCPTLRSHFWCLDFLVMSPVCSSSFPQLGFNQCYQVLRVTAGYLRPVADPLLGTTARNMLQHTFTWRRRHSCAHTDIHSQQFPAGNQTRDNLFCHTLISTSLPLFSASCYSLFFFFLPGFSSSTQRQHL